MTTYGCSIVHQMAIAFVLLSIASHLAPGDAQQSLTIDEQQQPAMQMFFNELINSGPADDKNNYYAQQLKYHQLKNQLLQQQQQHLRPKQLPIVHYANQWPSLRDLVISTDYDSLGTVESSEQERERDLQGSQLLARLHKFADNAIDSGDQLLMLNSGVKQHNSKRNAQFRKQYMRPCHFKICNMGR